MKLLQSLLQIPLFKRNLKDLLMVSLFMPCNSKIRSYTNTFANTNQI